jgi:hypothetical protein
MEEEIGKKSTKTSQTTTSAPPSWAVPLIQGGANDVLNTYNQNQPQLGALETGLTGSTIPGLQQQIGDTKQQLQPGFNYVNSTLSPGFLDTGSSQAQALGNYAGQQAGNAVNSAFSQAGRTGSGNHATDLARGVTQAELSPMLQNLQYNEGIQNQAAGLLPGMTAAQYAGYTPLLGATQLAGQLPYYGSQSLGTMGSLLGNYGTSTSTGSQPGGWLNGLLSAGASLGSAAIMASDRRLKTNITLEHRDPDGLGWYSWNWKSNPNGKREEGVIADEVEKLRPWAFVKGFVGGVYDGVNYATVGSVA